MSRLLRRLLLFVPLLLIIPAALMQAQLPGWRYTRPFLIDNSRNAEALSGYQIRIVFNHKRLVDSGWARPDGGDLRWTRICGGPELPHWIENGLNSVACTTWVRLDQVAARAKIFIFLQFGNPLASTSSNADAVFELYDDFQAITPAKWQRAAGSSALTGSLLPVVENVTWGGSNYIYSTRDFGYLNGRGIVEARTWSSSGGGNIIFFVDDPTVPQHYLLQHDNRAITTDYDFGRRNGSAAGSVGGREYQFANGDWVLNTIEFFPRTPVGTSVRYFHFSETSALGMQEIASATDNWTWHRIGFSTFLTPGASFAVDWVRVRKYTPVEPTANERELPQEVFTFSPLLGDLTTMRCEEDMTLQVSLTNLGKDAWFVRSVRVERGDVFSIPPTPAFRPDTLFPLGTRTFPVRFTPPRRGPWTDTLILTVDNSCPQEVRLPIRAVKDTVGFRVNRVWRDTLDFGLLCQNQTKDTTFELESLSSVTSSVQFHFLPRFEGRFPIDTAIFRAFAPGERRSIRVGFIGAQKDTTIISTFVITDDCGDSSVIRFKARVQSPTITMARDTTVCPGTAVRLGSPPQSGYRYEWEPKIEIDDTSLAQPTVRPTTTRTYRLTVTDTRGCRATDSITVGITNQLKPRIYPAGGTFCEGDVVTLSVGTYADYIWRSRRTGATAATPTFAVTADDTVYVQISNGLGCVGYDTVIVRFAPRPTGGITGRLTTCPGTELPYDAPFQQGVTYEWSPETGGTVVSGQGSASVVVRWTSDGTWRLRLRRRGAGGCVVDTSITVEVGAAIQPEITTISGATEACEGDTLFLRTVEGYRTYRWRTPERADTTPVTILTSPGTHDVSVFVFDSSGCSGSSRNYSFTIHPRPRPTISGEVELCPSISSYTAGGSTAVEYLWSVDSGGVLASGATNPFVDVDWIREGTWPLRLQVRDRNGCASDTVLMVRVKGGPSTAITPSGPLSFCIGDSVTLTADPGFERYLWSTGDTSESILVTTSGDYTVRVFRDGCSGLSAPTTVTVNDLPVPVISASNGLLASTPAASYQWYFNGAPIQDATARELAPTSEGEYVVEVVDSNGCRGISAPFTAGGAMRVVLPSLAAAPGATVRLPLVATTQGTISMQGRTFVATIAFDRSLLLPLAADRATMATVVEGDSLVVTLTGVRQSDDTLAVVDMLALLGRVGETRMSLRDLSWQGGAPTLTSEDGLFRLEGVCVTGESRFLEGGSAAALRSVRPNPLTGQGVIEFDLVEDGPTRLALSDRAGHSALVLHDGHLDHGNHSLSFDAAALPAGVYTLILQTRSDRLATPVVIVH